MHLTDAIETVRSSIVQILVEPPGQDATPIGTGFIVSDAGHALTARHVIEAADEVVGQGGRLLAGLAVPNVSGPLEIRGSFEIVLLRVTDRDRRHDLALVELVPNPFESGRTPGIHRTEDGITINALWGLARLNVDRPRDGESVAITGYPLAEPALVTTAGHVASAWGVDIQEFRPPDAPEWVSIPDVRDSYLIDAAINPGNSGGPVFRVYTGEVIAVGVAFRVARAAQEALPVFSYNSGLAVAVPIRYGVELLRAHLDKAR